MAKAQVISLFPDKYPAAKGSAWLVCHRAWGGGGVRTSWAFVYNFDEGLTAYEAWQAAGLMGSPPFYEVVTFQLSPYPATVRGLVSVDTKTNERRIEAPKKKRHPWGLVPPSNDRK